MLQAVYWFVEILFLSCQGVWKRLSENLLHPDYVASSDGLDLPLLRQRIKEAEN
ncbi:hypothetical protein GMA8713_02986 [Grimontia marina]|uniref:Uncharacterized protein n=1 Tax=Grimontia marina TaxID=646534 RepID=A0A128FCF6_9GAMM|nr:hypothetical protein GMA8713_02986 [Grimontia marina]